MKKIIIFLCILVYTLSACQQADNASTQATQPIEDQTPYPTATDYPTQTVYPTQTPLPTPQPSKQDISAAMALPEENLDWYLTYDHEFYFETWMDQSVMHSRMESTTEDHNTGAWVQIDCQESGFNENVVIQPPPFKEIEGDIPSFGDVSKAYEYRGRIYNYGVFFLKGNCYVQTYTQRIESLQTVYEMAELIAERLPDTDQQELVFPTYEINEDAFSNYFISVNPLIDKNNAGFKVTINGRKPFINHVVLGLYDKTNQVFLGRRDYFYFSFLESWELKPTRHFSASKLIDYQLWVWAEDELVYISDYVWEE